MRDQVASTFLSPLSPDISCMGSVGCCAVAGKTACHILFGVMQLVRVSKVSESLCCDELASGFRTGHLTEGL